jgi:hypothetical protein
MRAASLILLLLLALAVPRGASVMATPTPALASVAAIDEPSPLDGIVRREVLDSALAAIARHGLTARTVAIADMSQPSTERRLVVVDLATRRPVLRTWVAHGQGSGGLLAERFSNRPGSLATSRGLYRVGERIMSPKHGAALLLDGLDVGLNDRARDREVIIHGADYVSAEFVERHGRLGRSWGCPAVPRGEMERMIALLEGDGFLFVHGG